VRYPARIVFCFAVLAAAGLAAQSPLLSGGLTWRDIGPMRGGRSVGVAGVPSQPDTYYFGSVGGGVWKTENSGRTWTPIFDDEPVQSIGAISVAPSDPNIIYVGTGEADIRSQTSYGDGMYKSSDAGRTWRHIGLDATQRIGRIVVDPSDPNRVYVAALGHAYDANPDRGVYRSLDGGATWKKILYHDENVGAIDIALDPNAPRTMYASLWATRRPPWNVYAPSNMPGSGLYKSTNGGDSWSQLHGGLPADNAVGKIGIAVAPSNSRRLWAVVDDLSDNGAHGGVYLSDDAGANWRQVNNEQRLWGRGWYFEAITVDPKNPDQAYIPNTSTYVTRDAGKTWTPIKGAPGGDDYHQLWVNPRDGNRMVLSSDQGTVVSVDEGKTWSSWYNQPTAEIYHLSADNRFPWWVYGAQQDSGPVGVATWSKYGMIDERDWRAICAGGESGMVVPDPKDGNILFGEAGVRCNQDLNIIDTLGAIPAPAAGEPGYRKTWTLPLVFSAADQALYYGNQYVFRTRDSGKTWERISDDLTRENPGVPANLDAVTAKDEDNRGVTNRKGVVYTIAPSPIEADTIWAGTDDGLIQVTHDAGKKWTNVTPPPLTPWSKVSMIEASRFDAATAFASVDRHRLADTNPYIYRTTDGGRSWRLAVAGIPGGSYVNSIKEDTERRGLLFAATEFGVYVSYDNGDRWQSLQLNLPRASARDFVVHGDALVVATHGRGFWVIDDIAPLRQVTAEIAAEPAHLYKPGVALDVRQGHSAFEAENGTPFSADEPQRANPPIGAILYYSLKTAASSPVTLDIVDASGTVFRHYSSADVPPAVNIERINVEAHWLTPPPPLSAAAGLHRWVWDLQGETPKATGAAAGDEGPGPTPPAAAPGAYTVRLTVDGRTYEQRLTVKPDPRGGE